MSTTAVTPTAEVVNAPAVAPSTPVVLTAAAITKVKEIMATFEDLKVFVDATSAMYLNGCTVDYVETLEAAGFKFDNPQVKSTCGCGSSFSV